MRTLGKGVLETFKEPPKWFTRFLLELHDVLPNENSFVDRVEFLQEDIDEIIPWCDRITAKLYSHFLARSLREKGTKRNLTASSPNWGILIIKHISSNSLMKKYVSSDSKPRNLGRVLMHCSLSSKLLPLASRFRMQDNRDVLMGRTYPVKMLYGP